jgi:hypothetical protein
MIIEHTAKELIIRLPLKKQVEDVQDIVDMFEYKELAKNSKATQKDVDSLISKIKKGRWKRTQLKLST